MKAFDGIQRRIDEGEIVVLDGGMGTELQARGLPMDVSAWSAVANLLAPAVVRGIHEDYVRAGATVLITNTYSAARPPLVAAGFGDHVREINRQAVTAALDARSRTASHPVAVAGSMSHVRMGDTGAAWPTDEEGLLRVYREQAELLADAGVDLLILEMIGSASYGMPALTAAAETGLPVWLGVSSELSRGGDLKPRGHGDTSFDSLVQMLVDTRVAAILVMHTDVRNVDASLDSIEKYWRIPYGIYPHSGTFTPPTWVFGDMTASELVSSTARWVARGAQLVGGCCGTGPAHIRALSAEFATRVSER